MQEYHVRNDRYHASSCIHLQTDWQIDSVNLLLKVILPRWTHRHCLDGVMLAPIQLAFVLSEALIQLYSILIIMQVANIS